MIFEDILNDVGGNGPYQKFLSITFLIPASLVIPWFSMNSIFLSSTPEHWCFVPEVAASNLPTDAKLDLLSPPNDPSCSMYDINYAEILSTENFTVNPSWPTKACDNGWEFDKTNYDATSVTRWEMVCEDDYYSSLVISLSFVGVTLGTPLCGFLSDRIGRKPALMIFAFMIAVTEISSVLSPYFWMFLFLRTLNGCFFTSIYTIVFILLLEVVSSENRAKISGISTFAWTIGMCILPAMAWLTRNWIYLSAMTATASACLLLYWKIIHESPSWLIGQGKYQKAYEILSKISQFNGKENPDSFHLLEKIQSLGAEMKSEKENEKKSSPREYILNSKLRKRFILVTICWVCANMPYYGHQVNSRNLEGNEFLNFFYLSAVEVPASIVAWIMMESIGRRWSAVAGYFLSTIACIIPIIVPPNFVRAGVIAALLAKAGSSVSYQVIYQHAPELFPTSLRAVGMGLCSTIGSGSVFAAPYVAYLSKYGFHVPFICFAIIAFLGGFLTLFLPETLNQRLPQTVADVENYISNQKFFSCGIVKESKTEDIDTSRRSSFIVPRAGSIDPVEVLNILRRGSVDSVYVISGPNLKS